MSVKVMSYVWDIPLFKGSDKLVMLCLADHADDNGVCWPSIDTIARKSGVSPTTVKSTLKKLEASGWLFKKNQFKKAETGRLVRSNNQYQLPVLLLKKKADEQTDFEQSNFVHSKIERSNLEQTKEPDVVGQISTGGRAESDHKPSIDPPIEPSVKDLVPSQLETEKPHDPVLFQIPLKGKSAIHQVTQSQLFELRELYPAVDVVQQLRNMIGWCKANPTRQKTAQGIMRFIHSWLCKEQDKGYGAAPQTQQPKATDDRDVLKRKIRELEMDINNENAALLSFQQRKSPVSQDAAKSSQRKLNEMMAMREQLVEELGRLDGE
ncbi:helix-turn-helix domain-containing protein [Vibrio ziniensis]|uniref:Helix-turn-helix domain-containing protein n=1 Tax=Vibrio ziniensis TaxID=2711221 RepID=A0A6G7CH62_9VIBR|nr:helix-turn-helix domain-containing protein [Vibrio ziniensis]QIH41429.1 helix-turn-helix domain-containing protein [Vibrio ziniensis]